MVAPEIADETLSLPSRDGIAAERVRRDASGTATDHTTDGDAAIAIVR